MQPDEIAGRVSELVSLPRAYHRISEMLHDERCGAADMGRVISHEPALTARLLRLVNSAFYRLPRHVDTVPLAINVVGTRALHELVLATTVASAFARIDNRLVDMADFWHHSIYCGLMARLLSRELDVGESEQAFIAGLLHDLGKLALYHELPDETADILERFAAGDAPLHVIEREHLGFDHADVGGALLRAWELPQIYQEVVACHHRPGDSRLYRDEACLVHTANALSKPVEPGHKVRRERTAAPELDSAATARIRVDAGQIEELRVEADLQSIEVYATLFGR